MKEVPVIPESAPFTPEQRAYLNGFFAGLFSRAPWSNAGLQTGDTTNLTILFGSQTGNAENLAKRLAKEAGNCCFAPTIHDLAKYPTSQLTTEKHLLIITSTYGDGEPPDNAKAFWEFLSADSAPKLNQVRYSVCALGDTNYPKFCAFGKAIDDRLAKLGAIRVQPHAECDVEYEEPFCAWMNLALAALEGKADTPVRLVQETSDLPAPASLPFSRSNPFPARLLTNRRLSAPASSKDVRHFEIALTDSGLCYEVGDALAVCPQNDPALVDELLTTVGVRADETVPGRDGKPIPLREALTTHYEITRIPKPLLEAFALQTGDELLKRVACPTANGELTKFLWGREIIDLLLAHPGVKFQAAEFIGFLRKLQPRLYSISSSPKAHPGQVHLTISTVRYESLGRARKGVCSTFLADRVCPETAVPVFVHTNKSFRAPPPDAPLIMVGPGTGIAPFRAFLEERRAVGATGRNWLFFGDQKAATDFLYRDEIEAFQKDGLLTRLHLAWSRDQPEKIYVQQRMIEHAAELFAWLETGAYFYVCGDASRMARDVDAALHQVIRISGGKTPEQASAYVAALKKDRRYRRDVY